MSDLALESSALAAAPPRSQAGAMLFPLIGLTLIGLRLLDLLVIDRLPPLRRAFS